MDKAERKALRKSVKKDANKVGYSLLLYTVIFFAVIFIWLLGMILSATVGQEDALLSDTDMMDGLIDEVADSFEQSGASMIAGVVIGLGVLFLMFRKNGTHREIFKKGESVTLGKLAGLTCVFLGGQLVFQGGYALMELGLNAIGYTAEASAEAATIESNTLSMLLYAGIIGPIVEELIYRGFVMRALEKHGKVLAIFVSSLLFGIMHANLPQAIFAFAVGLVLGYVAMRYSIIWSIVLHIFNNFVLGEGMELALSGLGETAQTIVFYSVMGAFFLAGIIYLIAKRKDLAAYIKENRTEKPRLRWVLTASGIVLFIAVNLYSAITMLEKL